MAGWSATIDRLGLARLSRPVVSIQMSLTEMGNCEACEEEGVDLGLVFGPRRVSSKTSARGLH